MFKIQFMTRKDVEAEENKKIDDFFENDYFAKFIAGGVCMGFKFKTLGKLNTAARILRKEPNEFVMELIESCKGQNKYISELLEGKNGGK